MPTFIPSTRRAPARLCLPSSDEVIPCRPEIECRAGKTTQGLRIAYLRVRWKHETTLADGLGHRSHLQAGRKQ